MFPWESLVYVSETHLAFQKQRYISYYYSACQKCRMTLNAVNVSVYWIFSIMLPWKSIIN